MSLDKIEVIKRVANHHENGFHFSLSGALTFKTVMQLWRKRDIFFESKQKHVYLDLSEVTRTDSAGLAFLLSLLRESKHNDYELQLVNVPQQLIDIAHLSGLEAILPISR